MKKQDINQKDIIHINGGMKPVQSSTKAIKKTQKTLEHESRLCLYAGPFMFRRHLINKADRKKLKKILESENATWETLQDNIRHKY